MEITSKIKNYQYEFLSVNESHLKQCDFFIVDANVALLHSKKINLERSKTLLIDAIETNKTYEKCQQYIDSLLNMGVKRGNTIGCIGGGIIQDITGFITSILFRGLKWNFFPTTLLAQADSCIGGKTSINLGMYKNIVGNFNPPEKIIIDVDFLATLTKKDRMSGFGEIIKVNLLDPKKRKSIDEIIGDLNLLLKEDKVTSDSIQNALLIKKEIIEIDEFDTGLRNIMNYGHTFGHAIETMTKFQIDHGIAVVFGMYIANKLSARLFKAKVEPMQRIIKAFIGECNEEKRILLNCFSIAEYMNALKKDKKNLNKSEINCILPLSHGKIFKKSICSVELQNVIKNNFKKWISDVN